MFPWNIAKSAEAMFSRWAVKKVCKFLLKKKLGHLILGDIDLNQLDVQLRDGTIQLSDLALNVDYINNKLGAAATVIVKEGSIGSLLVSMPWKGKGCQIEVDELELVLAPRGGDIFVGSKTCNLRRDGNSVTGQDPSGTKPQIAESTVTNSPVDIHEGVKTIAKMVKWLLTSFHIKIKKTIVAFDPSLSDSKNNKGFCRTLVLRISEVECGTDISEGLNSNFRAAVDNFLGLSRLTNFVKFEGAVLEFLQMDDDKLNATTPVVTGERGGFSGTVRLSIPWNNGSLDIHKVDADIYIDPLQLRFQPCTVKCFLYLWDIFKDVGKNKDELTDNASESVFFNAASYMQSTLSSYGSEFDKVPPNQASFFANADSRMEKEKEAVTDAMLPGSHLISDWVPSSISRSQGDKTDEEHDFEASVDQFFECFDGLRNSESALGSSGILNWTCSVFSAITAASNLASGSIQIPSEQKHVETSLKAAFAGISFCFSFLDEDQTKPSTNSHDQYIGTKFEDTLLVMQVFPTEMNFEATVGHIELADHFSGSTTDVKSQVASIAKMQDAVESAFSPFCSSTREACLGGQNDDLVKVMLLRTSGSSHCQLRIGSEPSLKSFAGPIYFSLKLPPVVVWVNFHLISMVLDLFKEFRESFKTTTKMNHAESLPCPQTKITTSSREDSLIGDLFLPNAKIMFCFPFENGGNCGSYYSWDQFIALDFSLSEEKVKPNYPTKDSNSTRYSSTSSRSLDLNVGNLALYLITPASREIPSYFAEKFLSVTDNNGHLSTFSMIWQAGSVTGPWIAKKAKRFASSEDLSSKKNKFMGKGFDFASVSTIKDVEDFDAQAQKEMILSSTIFLHAHLSSIVVTLATKDYGLLLNLLGQAVDWCKTVASDPVNNREEGSSISQASVHVEFDSLEIRITTTAAENIKKSLQSELPGSWHSFKVQVQNFELFSVSNIGGISGASFLWVGRGESNMWGSITGVLNKEFLLISCSNFMAGRGDGEGSNVLSSRVSGSEIAHFSNPNDLFSHTSITIRCCTIVAVGGRLDWFVAVSSFFVLPSTQLEKESETNTPSGSTFIINLVDIGLSYEPYLNSLVIGETGEQHIACLLAASAVKLSNIAASNSREMDYKISFQDLGLLLSEMSGLNGTYDAENLRKNGYVKIAQEAHVQALVRIGCENGYLWELDCSDSHILLGTCADTTFGMIRLASQLQQLFAPDLEEIVGHLQTRWNNVHQTQDSDYDSSTSQSSKSCVVNFMDAISEDAFLLDGNCESKLQTAKERQLLSHSVSFPGSVPEFIDGYFLSNLRPLSEPSMGNQSPKDLKGKSANVKDKEFGRGNSRWYGDTSLRILENHVSENCEPADPEKLVCGEAHRSNIDSNECGKLEGRVLLKNINVKWRLYGGSDWQHSQRDATKSLELELCEMNVQYELFPEGEISVSKLSLSIKDFCLNDNSKDAPWKMVLGYYQSKGHPREYTSKAMKLDLEAVRPHPSIPLEEYRLRVAFLPMRLHLHQSQLDFLISFFGGKNSLHDQSPISTQDLDEYQILPQKGAVLGGHNLAEEALLPYFQKFDILPVIVRVDYSPSHVDLAALSGGKYVELVNLIPWKGVKLQLKHVQAVGVYGWGCVGETIIGEWLEDISQNQVHKLLKGLPPIRSLISVGSGAAKMVSLPVKNYKKDHRLLKGMQRGAFAFLRSISLEAVGLGVHLAAGAHDVLLQAEYILTSVPSSIPCPEQTRVNTNVRSNQPKDARQGIQQAYDSISDGLGKTASALVQTPLRRYQRGDGIGPALATAVQAAPAAAIAPASAAARAVHCALLGVRNSLDPEHKKESMEKYLGTT